MVKLMERKKSSIANDPTRTTSSGARLLRVIFALRSGGTVGVSNNELSTGLDLPPGTVNRLMNTAVQEGFAKQLESGRFVLCKSLLDIANAHKDALERELARLNEHAQNNSVARWR